MPRSDPSTLRRLLTAALVLLPVASCGDAPPEASSSPAPRDDPAPAPVEPVEGPPDVVLVTIDTLRADRVGCYGYERETTPTIDRLAREGTRVEIAYSPIGTTMPAHGSLLTSMMPVMLGMNHSGLELPEGLPTLAERFREGGYVSAGFASAYELDPKQNFDQGFVHYDVRYDPTVDDVKVGYQRSAASTVDALVEWLNRTRIDYPLFLFVQFFDPSEPYDAPRPYNAMFRDEGMSPRDRKLARYDAEIRFADDELGRVLEALDVVRAGRERVTVVTSPHGEGLDDHGWYSHNAFTYEEELRVPLVFHGTGVARGAVLRGPAQLLDVGPTLLALVGIEPEETDLPLGGVDLSEAVRTGVEPEGPTRPVFLQRPLRRKPGNHAGRPAVGMGYGLRWGKWKYFEAREEDLRELYDLEQDPRERRNLAEKLPDVADQCSAIVAAWFESLGGVPERVDAELSEEARASLRAYGYLEE